MIGKMIASINRRNLLKQAGAVAGLMATTGGAKTLFAATPEPAPQSVPVPTNGLFTLPALPYAYDALEPFFDAETMKLHHDKHHQAYVTNLNAAITANPSLAGRSLTSLLTSLDTVPDAARSAIRNQGGGHANHSFWWPTLGKGGSPVPLGELAKDIDAKFGSFTAFQEQFTKAATSVFGSGWAWLNLDPMGELHLEATPNQDSPITLRRVPVLGVDVWEHAYYLKYQNRRPEFVKNFFSVVNWEHVSFEYTKAKDCCKVPTGPKIS